MTKYAGSDLTVTFGGTALSDHGASLDIDESHPAADVTGFTQDDGNYVAGGVTHRKATFQGFDDTEQTKYAQVAPGTTASLVYTPKAGVASKTCSAIVTSRKRGIKVGDKVALTVEFQCSGAVS